MARTGSIHDTPVRNATEERKYGGKRIITNAELAAHHYTQPRNFPPPVFARQRSGVPPPRPDTGHDATMQSYS